MILRRRYAWSSAAVNDFDHAGAGFLLNWGLKRAHRRSLERLAFDFFLGGFVFDTTGTGIMLEMAGGITLDIHGLTGLIAILLMLVHSIWATMVLIRKDERAIINFHKFSLVVWLIWLVPYFSGFFLSMGG